MSKNDAIDRPARGWEKRYQVLVTTDKDGCEHLTIERLTELPDAVAENVSEDQLVEIACRIYDSRRARSRYFESSMLGEPVWDMLLALYCLPASERKLSVTGLCYAADVPMTTGLRWVQQLEKEGLVERTPDWKDGRRSYLHLTPKAEQLMRDYMAGIYNRMTGS